MQSLNPSPRLSSKSHVHPGVRIRDRQERDHHPEGHRSPSCLPATGLDRQLYRRPRGLLALQAGRHDDAVRELRQAVWTPVEGWGRTIVELANAKLAQGRPWDAVATLRMAYATRLDAMGRYVPISESIIGWRRLSPRQVPQTARECTRTTCAVPGATRIPSSAVSCRSCRPNA